MELGRRLGHGQEEDIMYICTFEEKKKEREKVNKEKARKREGTNAPTVASLSAQTPLPAGAPWGTLRKVKTVLTFAMLSLQVKERKEKKEKRRTRKKRR